MRRICCCTYPNHLRVVHDDRVVWVQLWALTVHVHDPCPVLPLVRGSFWRCMDGHKSHFVWLTLQWPRGSLWTHHLFFVSPFPREKGSVTFRGFGEGKCYWCEKTSTNSYKYTRTRCFFIQCDFPHRFYSTICGKIYLETIYNTNIYFEENLAKLGLGVTHMSGGKIKCLYVSYILTNYRLVQCCCESHLNKIFFGLNLPTGTRKQWHTTQRFYVTNPLWKQPSIG